MIEYKGYTATVEYDPDEESFRGRVANVRDVISFYGRSVEDLKRQMKASIDDYLEFCAEQGVEPAKPFSGRFNVRMDPDTHRAVAMAAASSGRSMNDWVVEKLQEATRDEAEAIPPERTRARARRSPSRRSTTRK